MKKVLIAEDESAIREIISITLKRAGYEVTEACDGQQALDTYHSKNGEFDVVLLDIMMPNVDGLEVCKRLRNESSTVGIIMLTAKTQEMDKVSGLLMGADDYITKPFHPLSLWRGLIACIVVLHLIHRPPFSSLFVLIKLPLSHLSLIFATAHFQSVACSLSLHRLNFRLLNISFQIPVWLLAVQTFLKRSGENHILATKRLLMLISGVYE